MCRASDQAGSALIIGAMAVLAIGLAAIVWLRVSGPELALSRAQQAGQAANRIATAIVLYRIRHNALPAPDKDGVPWHELGLAPQDGADPWGHRFVYALAGCGWSLTSPGGALRWDHPLPAESCQAPAQGR